KTRWKRGGMQVTVRPFKIAEFMAFQVSLKNKKTDEKKTGVLVGGSLIPKQLWSISAERYQEEIERFVEVREHSKRVTLPHDMARSKLYPARAEPKSERADEVRQDAEIKAAQETLTAQILKLKAEGRAPKGIVFYVEGPDGVGKTSTAGIVADA